ncbi:MAG: paraquat-inducible protein A [Deltaproteobacteria bacterium]|nr:paraquat-inducible protein A [Deltaproteobacteria bacterium]
MAGRWSSGAPQAPADEVWNQAMGDDALIACPDCDLLQRLPALTAGASARCPRCGRELWRHRVDALDRSLALALAAAVLFVVANAVPMLGLSAVGHSAQTTVIGGAAHLWNNGEQPVAALVLTTAVLAPAAQIVFMLVIATAARRARPPAWVGVLLRYHPTARIWSMIEVMLLGVLVALIKIADYATVIPGLALYVLGVLVFLLAGMQASFDPREVWSRIEWASQRERSAQPAAALEGSR